jgi:hypothetical protein
MRWPDIDVDSDDLYVTNCWILTVPVAGTDPWQSKQASAYLPSARSDASVEGVGAEKFPRFMPVHAPAVPCGS